MAAPTDDSSLIISATARAKGIVSKWRERGLRRSVAGKAPEESAGNENAPASVAGLGEALPAAAGPACSIPGLTPPKCRFASSMAPQTLSRRNRRTRAPGRSFRSRAPTCRAKPAWFSKMPPARTNSTGAPGPRQPPRAIRAVLRQRRRRVRQNFPRQTVPLCRRRKDRPRQRRDLRLLRAP